MDNHSCTVVTTRHSGGSYLNSVELMNGCLSVAHSNCFIPSTLGGPVEDENGINTEQLKRNLDLAADVYISSVNGAPCCGTTVQLCKGNRRDCAQKLLGRRQKLLTFLHGKVIEKQKLLKDEPDIFHYFRKVWDVCNNHMVQSIPKQYAFMLLPCFKDGCIHPLCKTGKPAIEPHCTWFPNGPPLSYFPLPIPDVDRPWGGDCTSCSGFCAGHYKKPEDAWKSYQEKSKTICQIKPPLVTLLERFDESVKKGFDLLGDENRINELAKQMLLTPNEVKMWLKHLKAIKLRRKEGAKKAAATRAAKKALHAKNNSATPANDRESSAANCPCGLPDNEDNMIACENPKCDVEWYHISCVGLDELGNTDLENLEWYCPACDHEDLCISMLTDNESSNDSDKEDSCHCGRPNSVEEMIGCDGDDCEIKWYHFSCAGLTAETVPDGQWLCPMCSNMLTS
ncbi:Chromatin modification-related YNG2 [Paramuricea clavata]|uniref:Chromatin modification-related YNG2 n=1 Tax=Paramuricea clavata TaxID=317549 RepID=A0A7D9K5B0_PARCT|nr:Chromatin modification-related YNG2 [Paramuricea clavata]